MLAPTINKIEVSTWRLLALLRDLRSALYLFGLIPVHELGFLSLWQEISQERLLQNVNLQMAREEYELNGQQGLDELLSVFAVDELQARLQLPMIAKPMTSIASTA